MEPQGVYYIAEGRTRHYMMAGDGTEKILYTLSAGWFYGETPVSLQEPTGLFSNCLLYTSCDPQRGANRDGAQGNGARTGTVRPYGTG